MSSKKIQTIAARTGICSDSAFGAVVPPLYVSTNFTFAGFGKKREYDYSRSGNPTRDLLGDALAKLEGGAGAVITSSGMSALNLLTYLLPKNGHLLAPHDCYGGTFRLLKALAEKGALRVTFVDYSKLDELAQTLRDGVDLALVETPSNPLLRVVDLAAIAKLCKANGTLLAADNTFLSPALQRPIALGADLVVHSTTKYLNGHSDVVGGAVVAANDELAERLVWWANCTGLTGSPFDSFLTLRGVRTLVPRMRSHLENTEAVVNLLAGHPLVKKVHYPGLASHPGHEIAKRQQSGFGAIVSFELQGGESEVRKFLEALQLFSLAESLGGVESLVAHPASMTHASMAPEARAKAGITEQLVRLSVGIENSDDLVHDLKRALDLAADSRAAIVDVCPRFARSL